MSIGIGLATVVFVLADSVLWQPLPYEDPDALVVIRIDRSPDVPVGSQELRGRAPTLAEWQSRTDLFEALAAYGRWQRIRFQSSRGASLLQVTTISPNFFSVLRPVSRTAMPVMPPLPNGGPLPLVLTGRSRSDHAVPAPSHDLLQADDGRVFQVAAALPPDFLFPVSTAFLRSGALVPANFEEVASGTSRTVTLTLIGRLRPGVAPAAVEARLTPSIADAGFELHVEPLRDYLTGNLRVLAFAALGAGVLIVLVCAANFLGLLVVRSFYRAPDFAVRQAIGASTGDVFRLVTSEIAILGLIAIAGSLVLADWTFVAIGAVIPESYLLLGEPVVSWRAACFVSFVIVIIVAACAALVWTVARSSSAMTCRAAAIEPRFLRSVRFLLTAGQTAVAMVLLVGAAFLARSYQALWAQDTGYNTDTRVVSVSYSPKLDLRRLTETVAATVAALRRVPGVREASAGTFVGAVLDGYDGAGGRRISAGDQAVLLMPSEVVDRYFEVSGTGLIAGRFLQSSDRSWNAVLVNEALARRLWPGRPAIELVGSPIVGDGNPGVVVGVVQDTIDRTLDRPAPPRLFKPMESVHLGRVSYLYQPSGDVDPAAGVRKAVLDADRTALIAGMDSITGRLAETVRDRTFSTLVLIIFAVAGLGVTSTGVYSLVAFVATRRHREIAIRMALGAEPGHVIALVVRGAMIAAGCGAAVGLTVGAASVRLLQSQLFGVRAGDPATFAAAVVVLLAIAAAAAWWPTLQALRVDPSISFRE